MEKSSRKIAYHPEFRTISGSAAAAILLSQYWYWTQNSKAIQRGGKFYKTQTEISEETGLSRSEYQTALKRLEKAGIVRKQTKGYKNKTWIQLDLLKLMMELGKLKSALVDSIKALIDHGTKAAVKAVEMAKKVFTGRSDAKAVTVETPAKAYCVDDFADCVQLIKSFAGYVERCAREDRKETLVKLFRLHGFNHNYVKKVFDNQLDELQQYGNNNIGSSDPLKAKYARLTLEEAETLTPAAWQVACAIKPEGASE